MTREVRLVVVAAAVVGLLGIASAVLLLNPQEQSERTITLRDGDPYDVSQILITNAHGTIDIARSGEGYEVDDIPAWLVDLDDLYDLLANSAGIAALRVAARSPSYLEAYGLSDPAARVAITYTDRASLTLLIGAEERVSGDVYVGVEGDDAVYLVEAERCAGFLLPKKALVEDLVTPELALSSPLSAILDVTFTGGSLDEPVTLEAVASKDPDVVRAALSFGAATHIMRGNGVYELDQTYGVEMLGALLGITASDIAGYGLTEEEIAAFGFEDPTMRVMFDLKNGLDAPVERYTLELLRTEDACYLTCNDRGVIYTVPEPAFLEVEYSKLPVRWFLSPLLLDVAAIDIVQATEPGRSSGAVAAADSVAAADTAAGDETYAFVITGETKGELRSPSEKQVTCNGRDLDIERFRDLFRLLISAAHDGRLLEGVSVDGPPLLQVTYHYLDAEKAPDVMKLYPGEARRLYVEVNGVTELAMLDTYLARVKDALAILWTDTPIETEW